MKPHEAELARRFGANLKRLRIARDLTQERLGEEADLHRNYVGMVERGERNIALINICRIARALGCEPADLLDGVRLRAKKD